MIRLVAHLLRNVRAGEHKLVWHDPAVATAPASIRLTSSAFEPGGAIPHRCAGAGVGENRSPDLAWQGIPPDAVELALIIEDPDAPLPRPFVHAIVTGIPAQSTGFEEGALSQPDLGARLGRNSFRRTAYSGPRALPGHGPHTYAFQLFALDRKIALAHPPDRKAFRRAVTGAVLARGRLDGRFERP